MPDFPNFDIAYPQPHWEEAIPAGYLTQVRKERPDFVLVAGDLVDGHYWDSREQLKHLTAVDSWQLDPEDAALRTDVLRRRG